jgi:hypothetical protein
VELQRREMVCESWLVLQELYKIEVTILRVFISFFCAQAFLPSSCLAADGRAPCANLLVIYFLVFFPPKYVYLLV